LLTVQQTLRIAETAKESLQKEMDLAKSTLSQMMERFFQTKLIDASFDKGLSMLHKELIKLESSKVDHSKLIDDRMHDLEALKINLKIAEDQIAITDNSRIEISYLYERINNLEAEKTESIRELELLSKRIVEIENLNESLKNDLNEEKILLNAEKQRVNNLLEQLKEHGQFKREIQPMLQENVELKKRERELVNYTELLAKNLEDCKNKNILLQVEIKDVSSSSFQKNQVIEELQKNLTLANTKITELNDIHVVNLKHLSKKQHELNETEKTLEQRLLLALKDNEVLENYMKTHKEENLILHQNINNIRETLAQKETAIQILLAANSFAKDEISLENFQSTTFQNNIPIPSKIVTINTLSKQNVRETGIQTDSEIDSDIVIYDVLQNFKFGVLNVQVDIQEIIDSLTMFNSERFGYVQFTENHPSPPLPRKSRFTSISNQQLMPSKNSLNASTECFSNRKIYSESVIASLNEVIDLKSQILYLEQELKESRSLQDLNSTFKRAKRKGEYQLTILNDDRIYLKTKVLELENMNQELYDELRKSYLIIEKLKNSSPSDLNLVIFWLIEKRINSHLMKLQDKMVQCNIACRDDKSVTNDSLSSLTPAKDNGADKEQLIQNFQFINVKDIPKLSKNQIIGVHMDVFAHDEKLMDRLVDIDNQFSINSGSQPTAVVHDETIDGNKQQSGQAENLFDQRSNKGNFCKSEETELARQRIGNDTNNAEICHEQCSIYKEKYINIRGRYDKLVESIESIRSSIPMLDFNVSTSSRITDIPNEFPTDSEIKSSNDTMMSAKLNISTSFKRQEITKAEFNHQTDTSLNNGNTVLQKQYNALAYELEQIKLKKDIEINGKIVLIDELELNLRASAREIAEKNSEILRITADWIELHDECNVLKEIIIDTKAALGTLELEQNKRKQDEKILRNELTEVKMQLGNKKIECDALQKDLAFSRTSSSNVDANNSVNVDYFDILTTNCLSLSSLIKEQLNEQIALENISKELGNMLKERFDDLCQKKLKIDAVNQRLTHEFRKLPIPYKAVTDPIFRLLNSSHLNLNNSRRTEIALSIDHMKKLQKLIELISPESIPSLESDLWSFLRDQILTLKDKELKDNQKLCQFEHSCASQLDHINLLNAKILAFDEEVLLLLNEKNILKNQLEDLQSDQENRRNLLQQQFQEQLNKIELEKEKFNQLFIKQNLRENPTHFIQIESVERLEKGSNTEILDDFISENYYTEIGNSDVLIFKNLPKINEEPGRNIRPVDIEMDLKSVETLSLNQNLQGNETKHAHRNVSSQTIMDFSNIVAKNDELIVQNLESEDLFTSILSEYRRLEEYLKTNHTAGEKCDRKDMALQLEASAIKLKDKVENINPKKEINLVKSEKDFMASIKDVFLIEIISKLSTFAGITKGIKMKQNRVNKSVQTDVLFMYKTDGELENLKARLTEQDIRLQMQESTIASLESKLLVVKKELEKKEAIEPNNRELDSRLESLNEKFNTHFKSKTLEESKLIANDAELKAYISIYWEKLFSQILPGEKAFSSALREILCEFDSRTEAIDRIQKRQDNQTDLLSDKDNTRIIRDLNRRLKAFKKWKYFNPKQHLFKHFQMLDERFNILSKALLLLIQTKKEVFTDLN
jgi:hypothetical protein